MVLSKSEKKIKRVRISNGKVHDFKMYKEKPVRLGKNKKMIADKGYQGIQDIHSESEIPIKKKRNQKPTKEEKQYNRDLSKRRMAIEHINRRVKIFRIFSSKYRNRRKRRKRFGLRVNLIVSIINMM
ncbi:MAG: transposase [Candidatus Caenarcaniphilales bacterium]|nr:transposase [Candidatus Caenarcaniphilales bacterium]